MKVQEIASSEKFSEKHDYRNMLSIKIDGKQELRFLDGEPEDANLSRDFNDAYKIVSAMKRAYDAGVAGEEFIMESVEVDDFY